MTKHGIFGPREAELGLPRAHISASETPLSGPADVVGWSQLARRVRVLSMFLLLF